MPLSIGTALWAPMLLTTQGLDAAAVLSDECAIPSQEPLLLLQMGARAREAASVHTHAQQGNQAEATFIDLFSSPGQDCIGHFTNWTTCSHYCERSQTFMVDKPLEHGGAECPHSDGHTITEHCVGGDCPFEELPPAGVLPAEDKPHTIVHEIAVNMQLPFFLCVVLALGIGQALHSWSWFKTLPESFLVVLVSGGFGLMLRVVYHADRWEAEDARPVSSATMNLVLLPVIIFNSGWAVPLKHMYYNFGYILVFAVFGTLVSTAAITGMILGTAELGLHSISDPRAAVATAVLMSATDPVATLATFAKKKVEPTLNILVFGESIINDAVAVVLFNLVNMDESTELFSHEWHRLAMKTVVELLLGSIAIGFAVGFVLVIFYRMIQTWGRLNTVSNTIYVLSSAYLANAVAESVHFSGIISCLFAGITMSIYLRPHLGDEDHRTAGHYLHLLAEFDDLTVFIMVGITTALLNSKTGIVFGLWLFLFCVLGRACSVFPCAAMCNCARWGMGQPSLCSKKTSTMMWHSGLRGGIALTLVMQLNDWAEQKSVLVTATFLVIALLLVVMGGTTDMMLAALGIEMGVEEAEVSYEDIQTAANNNSDDDTVITKAAKLAHRCLHMVLVGEIKPDLKEGVENSST